MAIINRIWQATRWLLVIVPTGALLVLVCVWLDVLWLARIIALLTGVAIFFGVLSVIVGVFVNAFKIWPRRHEAIPLAQEKMKRFTSDSGVHDKKK